MFTVLVADDEDVERSVISFLLEQNFSDKFQIIQASNGRDALALLQSQKVDVLLSDIEMPFLTGIDLAKKAQSIYPDIELLFFSGYDNFEYVQSALLLRAVNYVLKPLNPEQFCEAVSEILSRLESQRISFAKSNAYYDQTFYRHKLPEGSADENELSDQMLLKHIELAIQLKQPEQISALTGELLGRYSDASGRSHVYIRHMAADLLQMIIGGIPSLTTEDFDHAASEIYTLRYFSDIREIVQKYLDILLQEIHQEMDGPNYSIQRVKQYIEKHYGEDLTLGHLADQVYLSPNYLSNMFTKVTGTSLNKYIKQVRMKKAQELLVQTNMRIADIGTAVGYPTASYFIKAFQQMYGVTPMNYRMKHPPGS